MSTTDAIEKRFRNTELEYQAVAHAWEHPEHANSLDLEWLTVQPLAAIFKSIKHHRAKLTKASLAQDLKSRKVMTPDNVESYKAVLTKMEQADDLEQASYDVLCKQLAALAESRKILYGVRDIALSAKSFDLQSTKLQLKALAGTTSQLVDDRTGEWAEDYEQRQAVLHNRALVQEDGSVRVGIPTGIPKIDSLIGGILPGEFGVLAGQPGIGKSMALVSIGSFAYVEGYNVLYASGEMPKLDVQFRIDANLAGVAAGGFRTGKLTDEEKEKWRAAVEQYRTSASNFYEVSTFPRNFDADDLEREILRVQDKHEKKVDLVLVDYLNIMNSIGNRGSRRDWEAQSDAVWDLKGLLADINGGIAGWTAGQIKDEAFEVDQMNLSHLKYARAISETAPIVFGLLRTPDDELEGRLQLQVLKMRNAEPLDRPIYLHPNMQLMRLHERLVTRKSLLCLGEELGDKPKKKQHGKKPQTQTRKSDD